MSERQRNGLEIAVTGLAGRFPGAADVYRFWENLERGAEARTELSDDELAAAGVPPELLRHPDYVKASPVLDGADLFDAEFFGMTPREARLADPQQRLFLECAWEALEDAAWDPTARGERVGVFASSSFNRHLLDVLESEGRGGVEMAAALVGSDRDFLATRVAYKLDLRGPSLTVQTACSSSLVGVHLACQALLAGSCDVALAGGASISLPQRVGYLHQPESIHSPDGRCRAFDEAAAGCMRGSGVGVVVLRRLDDALEDGDPIRAVILGSAVNNDGSVKVGFTAPGVAGQEEVLRAALALAEVEPDSVGYIEAHGTGTAMGDPIEIEALNRVFAGAAPRREPCRIASVKTNIGHLDATAGVAGLIKAVGVLERGKIPASLHFRTPNPRLDLDRVPFEVPRETLNWRTATGPRRAGISSFGIGGTNAHVVLEEPPPRPGAAGRPEPASPWHLLVLSARSETALGAAAARLAEHLERQPAGLADVARTLALGRRAFNHRRIAVARDLPGAVAALRGEPDRRDCGVSEGGGGGVVFLLPGQGTRLVGRGRELAAAEPAFRDALDRCAEIARPTIGEDLRRLLAPGDGEEEAAREALAGTRLAQPALFALEYALAQMWLSWGVTPAALLGHSLGEWVATCLAGVFSLEDALALVAVRGRLTAEAPAGAMAAVALDPSEVEPRLGGTLALAAHNAPRQSVISGDAEELAELEAELGREGVRCTRLEVRHAFHSPLLDAVVPELVAEVRKRPAHPPRIPIVSNVTGRPLSDEEATRPEHWGEHLRRTVRFDDGLGWLLERSHRLFVEVGPGPTLASLVRRRAADAAVVPSLPDNRGEPAGTPETPEPAVARTSLGRLWVAGAEVDWRRGAAGGTGRRIPLPTYPFERRPYRIEPPNGQAGQDERAEPAGDAGAPGSPAALSTAPADTLAVPVFRREERTPAADFPAEPDPRPWLLVGESPLAAALAERLGGFGAGVTEISREPDAAAQLAELEPGALPARIVYFAGDVRGLLALARGLHRWASGGPLHLTVVGWGLCPVLGGDASPRGALVAGLAAAIPRELPGVSSTVLDLGADGEPAGEHRSIDRLAAELTSGAPPAAAVAYRGRHRWVRGERAIAPGTAGGGGGELPPLGSEVHADLERRERAISTAETVRTLDDLPGFEAATTRLTAAYALRYLNSSELELWPGEPASERQLRERLRVLPKFYKLFEFLLDLVATQGWAVRDGGTLTLSVDPAEIDAAALAAEARGRYPELRRLLALLDHCAGGYPEALCGDIEAIGVLYPDGDYQLLEEHLSELDGFRREKIYLRLLGEALDEMAGLTGGRPLRILEVGAGNGLLTKRLSEVLAGHRVRYCYTDLGRSFVQRASRRRSSFRFEHMDFRVFDISRDPVPQGLDAGAFDAVVAYNVVHATPRIDVSLGHLQTTLAPGGVLCLLETVRTHPWLDMIFGLAEGWWYFDDPFRPRSALMPVALWRQRLEGLGFAPVWAFPEESTTEESAAEADAAFVLAQRQGSGEAGGPARPPALSVHTLAVPAQSVASGSGDGWLAALDAGIERLDALRRSAADRIVTVLTVEPPAAGEPTDPAPGRALQAALAAYAEATAPEAGETTVVVEASDADALTADAFSADALAVPPGYALAVRRPAAAAGALPDASTVAPEAPETAAEEGGPRRGGDPVETAILEILRDLLGVERVEPGDRFVELGGDSLLALQVLSRVRREVGLELRVKDLMADRPLSELIAAAGRAGEPGGGTAGDRAPVTGRLPLLPSQAWFFERPTENPHLNTVPIFLEARETLRLAALRQTLAHLHRVHDALRLRIAGEADDRRQEIAPADGEIAFHAVDLSGLEPSLRAEEARRLAAQAQRRVDLFASPVQRSLWLGLGRGGGDPRGDRLLISTHHVAFDARSMQIFFEDLWTAYAACAAGEPPRITPPSATLADWVADFERYLASPRAAAELAWWTRQPWEETAEIPLDEVLGPNVLGSSEEVVLEIGGEVGAAVLRRLPRRWGVDVQEILLAAVVAALSAWTGRDRHMVHVVGHGREPFDGGCDASRILGWFSTPGHPLLLGGGGDPVEVLQSVSRRLRAVPDAGRGYTVLRYSSRDPEVREAIRRIPPTRVLFNYVSRFSDALETGLPVRLLHEPLGETVDPRRDRGIVLKVGAGMIPGGRIGLRFGYSANLHRRSTLEGLAERCRSWLEELAGRAEEG